MAIGKVNVHGVPNDPDLIPSNIREGVNIFDVIGTLVEGKKWASGTNTSSSLYLEVHGLDFQPSVVLANTNPATYTYGAFIKDSLDVHMVINTTASNGWAKPDALHIIYADGFKLQVPANDTFYWIAYE